MSRIQATTFVICPIGTTIELYTNHKPAIGQEFDVRHIDTKKIVQRAKVTKIAEAGSKRYRILAEITQVQP